MKWNENKKICDGCRKYYSTSMLIANIRGQFCHTCHAKLFPESKRYR